MKHPWREREDGQSSRRLFRGVASWDMQDSYHRMLQVRTLMPCYLLMYGVVKKLSTTTKLRVLFDASAKIATGVSLNDTLLPGPLLIDPLLSTVLNKCRQHLIELSANISKMIRKVGLHSSEWDCHQFLLQNSPCNMQDWRKMWLTFSIISSPYLAKQVLRQVAQDHGKEFPRVAHVVETALYVDECLTGAEKEAAGIWEELNGLLDCVKMTLWKWRSNQMNY